MQNNTFKKSLVVIKFLKINPKRANSYSTLCEKKCLYQKYTVPCLLPFNPTSNILYNQRQKY